MAKQITGNLPVIGLISRWASTEGGVGNDSQVWCRGGCWLGGAARCGRYCAIFGAHSSAFRRLQAARCWQRLDRNRTPLSPANRPNKAPPVLQAYPEFCRQVFDAAFPLLIYPLFTCFPTRRRTPSSAARCLTPRPRASRLRWPSCRTSMARCAVLGVCALLWLGRAKG